MKEKVLPSMELSENINHLVFIVDNDLVSISALNTDDREAIESIYYLYGVSKLKGPSQPPPFSMTSKLLIKLCELCEFLLLYCKLCS